MESHPTPRPSALQLLPYAVPADPARRLLLVCMRRMAAHGIRDAQAALLMVQAFGINFRRPLVLLRAFMADLADHATRRIVLAPCCALRMTADEARLLAVLAGDPAAAGDLAALTGAPAFAPPHATAAALAAALADLGRPL